MQINSNKVSYQYLESLPIKDKAYFITLIDYKGLRIKVNPSGRISFVTYARIKGGGNPRTITHGSKEKLSLPTAIDLHLQTIDLLEKGIDPNLLKKTKREQFNSSMKFIDIANELIRLSGYEPGLDIAIKFTGTRPGEKKIEELSLPTERLDRTKHKKIFVLNDPDITNETLSNVVLGIKDLKIGLSGRTANQVRTILSNILPEYQTDLDSKEPVYLRVKTEAEA